MAYYSVGNPSIVVEWEMDAIFFTFTLTLFDEESYLHQANQILYLVDVLKFFVRFCDKIFEKAMLG